MAISISGSGHNSRVNLAMIHAGQGYFTKDTATTHSQVALMQDALSEIGYSTYGVDGKFGNDTLNAVRTFQTAQCITVDGKFGQESLMTLEEILKAHLDPDNCEDTSVSTGNYTIGHFGKTSTTQVRLRYSPNTSASFKGPIIKGATFLIDDVVTGGTLNGSDVWVKIRFGTDEGNSAPMYVHSSCFEDIGSRTASAKSRCIEIAESLEGNEESDIALGGNCCQQFIYWLCGACGVTPVYMPYGQDYCGPARNYFMNGQGSWHHISDTSYFPQKGDLVYYGDPNDLSTSSHVGLVVKPLETENKYESIECNVGDMIKRITGNLTTGRADNPNQQIQGFATPRWI